MSERLRTDFAGIKMQNPVTVASGCFGYGEEYSEVFDVSCLGALVSKGITLHPQEGNPPPRLVETASGLINSIGLQNPGALGFAKDKLPIMKQFGIPIIVNISGHTISEYLEIIRILEDFEGIEAYEVNISCPNIEQGGIEFGQSPEKTEEIISKARKLTKRVLYPKLTPNVTDIKVFVRASEEGGADAISLINTLSAMSVDIETGRSRIGTLKGGLSGAAVKPYAVYLTYEARSATTLPIMAMGGIMNWQDAVEFMMVGANVIAVGTALFVNPLAPIEIIEGLEHYCEQRGLNNIGEIVSGFTG